jgi:SAM-dependent methyltransferase
MNYSKLSPRLHESELFPPLEDELAEFTAFFKGRVLNAGAGDRDISHLIDGELFNQDIPQGLHNKNIHIYSPLHEIPKPDGFFDAIICNAVLEHVANPDEIMDEFARVCRPGGALYLGVPFLQPEHKDPTDYQRYTADGLKLLAERHGFIVEKVEPVHNVYTTFGWMVILWLESQQSLRNTLLKWIFYPTLRYLSRRGKEQVFSLASCYRLLAIRAASVDHSG